MKTKQTILKAFASLALAMGAFASADAQSNLGAACGCPPVASRQIVNLTADLSIYTAVTGTGGGKLATTTLTCDKIWILNAKIYVDAGNTLTIEPGTIIKGNPVTDPAVATALVIARGGKIIAAGTESCPIVFTTSLDPMNGTYGIENTGKWGGVVLLGRAENNLTLAANGPFVPGGAGKLAVADGLGTVEGFASSYALDQYGTATSTPVSYVTATSPALSTYTFGQNASGVSGTNKITLTGNSSYVLSGMPVTGSASIPTGTTVTNISSNDVFLSANLTADIAANTPLTFTGTFPSPVSTSGQFFAGVSGTGLGTTPPFTSGSGPLAVATFTTGATTYTTQLVNFAAPFIGGASLGGSANNEDNSGIMKYVSIRHAGAVLSVGAEINGLTLASVGSGTTIDHIEIVSCADDNIEIFGGTVNLKYITTLFGNDDMFDYDLGWKGKAQFFFGMKNTQAGKSPDNDNGIEADSHDNSSMTTFRSHPRLYNFTIVGNGKAAATSDNRGLSGANFKDGAEGELYNSIFANFKNGINLAKSASSPVTYNSWQNWRIGADNTNTVANAGSLKIKCNTFIMNSATANYTGLGINADNTTATATPATITAGGELEQFTNDGNIVTTAGITGFSYDFTVNSSSNVVTVKNDVTPNPALVIGATLGCATPVDGFFEPANYRGAFSSIPGDNWLSNWSYAHVLGTTQGVALCPTDIDKDGDTDVSDFLTLISAFGTSCE